MVTVSHIMAGLERMLDYRGVGLVRLHCMRILIYCIVMNSASNKSNPMINSAIIHTRIRPAVMLTNRSVYVDIQLHR